MLKRQKMSIGSESAGKITVEGKCPCVVYRKGVDSNSIYWQFCKCWVD